MHIAKSRYQAIDDCTYELQNCANYCNVEGFFRLPIQSTAHRNLISLVND